jgi:hypothetical protein
LRFTSVERKQQSTMATAGPGRQRRLNHLELPMAYFLEVLGQIFRARNAQWLTVALSAIIRDIVALLPPALGQDELWLSAHSFS